MESCSFRCSELVAGPSRIGRKPGQRGRTSAASDTARPSRFRTLRATGPCLGLPTCCGPSPTHAMRRRHFGWQLKMITGPMRVIRHLPATKSHLFQFHCKAGATARTRPPKTSKTARKTYLEMKVKGSLSRSPEKRDSCRRLALKKLELSERSEQVICFQVARKAG